MKRAALDASLEREEAALAGFGLHLLRADLILAECERLNGDPSSAIGRLAAQKDYILTESGNWFIGMYTRAFPALLGMLAEAIGPMTIPVHILNMLDEDKMRECLQVSREFMDPRRWQKLARRLLGEEEARKLQAAKREDAPCRVRLFGTFEVWVKDRHVPDRAWKKRKARLMFAMLVVRRGQDVPRDQILEYLWPDMDEERARNNFYVLWNAMKKALVGETGKGACPYMEHNGGLCRVASDIVTSDLDEFDVELAKARQADAEGKSKEALKHYSKVSEIYRGDLLPGDLYDDWFAPLRDKCRQEFSDAMLRAAEILDETGDQVRALQLVRQGLEHDPWREDLYQAALKYQISVGQRSAAVETYMACKLKLCEDLGLDPSEETQRLYMQVLAMDADEPL